MSGSRNSDHLRREDKKGGGRKFKVGETAASEHSSASGLQFSLALGLNLLHRPGHAKVTGRRGSCRWVQDPGSNQTTGVQSEKETRQHRASVCGWQIQTGRWVPESEHLCGQEGLRQMGGGLWSLRSSLSGGAQISFRKVSQAIALRILTEILDKLVGSRCYASLSSPTIQSPQCHHQPWADPRTGSAPFLILAGLGWVEKLATRGQQRATDTLVLLPRTEFYLGRTGQNDTFLQFLILQPGKGVRGREGWQSVVLIHGPCDYDVTDPKRASGSCSPKIFRIFYLASLNQDDKYDCQENNMLKYFIGKIDHITVCI